MTAQPSQQARDLMAFSLRAGPPVSPDIVRLDSGDPDMLTPQPIRDAMSEALADGWVHYAHPHGDLELRTVIAQNVSRLAQRELDASSVTITHGATGALTAAILGVVDPGDTVVLPEPIYSLYADLVLMARGRVRYVPTIPPEFRLDIQALEKALHGARLLILCNPCNPTGAVYSRDELEAVLSMASQHGVLVLVDETYQHIVYPPGRFTSVLELHSGDSILYVQSFSKSYAMTGWRIGYVVASPSLSAAFARLHRTANGPVNTAVQRAALAALRMAGDWLSSMLAIYQRRRELVAEGLRGTVLDSVQPAGTFYAFAPHPARLTSLEMTDLALHHGVAVRPGTEFGPSGEGFLRIAFSASDQDVIAGVRRLREALLAAASGEHAPSSAGSEH